MDDDLNLNLLNLEIAQHEKNIILFVLNMF